MLGILTVTLYSLAPLLVFLSLLLSLLPQLRSLPRALLFALGFLFVLFILENILLGLLTWQFNYELADKIQNYFPLKSMYKLIDQPFQRIVMTKFPDKTEIAYDYAVHWYEIVIVLAWTALFIFLSYRLLKKRDL